jgi:aminoglycoside phosphotransferase (APT) family kinase protein
MGLRLRVGARLAGLALDLPVPAVLGGDAGASVAYLVSEFVAGASGRELLGDDAGAARLGEAMGGMMPRLAAVPAAGLRLSRTWSEPELLAPAATRWLEEAGSIVDAAPARRLRDVMDRLPEVFGGGEPVFAHGDYAPVNVLMRDGSVAAVLDFERARLGHPLFDAAWFRLMIRYHHPERWPAVGGAFLLAAGMEPDAVTLRRLDALASLQALEMIASTAARKPERRREWADRLACALG